MNKPYVKQESTELSNKGLDEQRFRDEIYKVLSSLNVKLASGSYQSIKSQDNTATFTAGQHKAFTTKTNDFIDAVAGAIVDVSVSFTEEVVRINNIHFKEDVSLSATASIIFTSCRFDKPISIESGGQAQFIGCSFRETSYVNNAGLPASVYVNGCVRTTLVHNNVTIISEIIA